MARAKQPVSVGGIEFDALLESEEGYEADVPEYPTEAGFNITDAIILKADTLTMTLFVTDTPVTWRNRTGSYRGKTETVVKRLESLYFAKVPVEVITSDAVYTNMAISNLNIKKTAEVGYAREIPITFKKITVTASATTQKSAGTASTKAASTTASAAGSSSSGSGSGSKSGGGSVLYNAASSFGLL